MSVHTIQTILDAAAQKCVLCFGDIMLDRFVYGSIHRISPEAPVPVLLKSDESAMPGAAGNVARNVIALGSHAILTGVIGSDSDGQSLIELLGEYHEVESNLAVIPNRCTTVKTRFTASHQQVLRLDNEDSTPLSNGDISNIITLIESVGARIDAVLISDYAKGVIVPDTLAALHRLREVYHFPIIVDPKGRDFAKYGPVDLIKPNVSELSQFTGQPCDSDIQIEIALRHAINVLPAGAILVTRSAKGMSWIEKDGQIHHLPTEAREVYDVSGAGDTSLAALGLGLMAGADIANSAKLALYASGIAVRKVGTASVSREEVFAEIDHKKEKPTGSDFFEHYLDSKLYTQPQILKQIDVWRAQDKKIGFTNGCFDLLHPGHLHLLRQAYQSCDCLIVALNTDLSVRRLKGSKRPINNESTRAEMLAALEMVDAVVLFDEDTPQTLIEAVKPDCLIKGGDYSMEQIIGADFVLAYGGEVKIIPLIKGKSTTHIISKVQG